ncbi:ABC transporter substrate-binding protein [Paenibacillus sp. J2TS4]|uniref:ABC transporter substrate-binding protein n=1 Tax=Paenibacillus sp. J2TS4 TaxID=2807194 RepID=UPI001B09FED7|nr:ABC transporter substrate-binding protein [Paenibacillus sp. J2TS4]GIP36438.1 peptide ABC transporter substrate-binding protein [Paenibacillus sp. J2TS4]
MKKWMLSLFIALITASLLMQGCGKNEANPDPDSANHTEIDTTTLIYAAETEFDRINPILEETTDIDNLIFRGLMRFDENNEPQKDIADSYEVSSDGLVYQFKLKQGIKFHDGEDLTAEDVVFTISSILDDQVQSVVRSEFTEIESVEAVSDYEVKITLKQPFPPLLDKLTIGIVPKHALDGQDINTADFNQHPIGSGPYLFDKWDRGQSVTLKAFPDYYAKQAAIDQVIVKFIPDSSVRMLQLETGEVDMAYLEPNAVEKMSQSDKLNIYEAPSADYRAMMYNMNFDLWKDVNVRKALNYAIDRSAIVDGILLGYGEPAYSPLQMNKYHNDQVEKYDFNLDKADELLTEAGWIPGKDQIRTKDGTRLAFTITAPSSDPVRVSLATYLSSQLKKVGADVKVAALDWSVIDIAETEAFMLGWGSPFDADDHTYKLFHSSEIGSGTNYGFYSDPDADRLLEEARTTTDSAKRQELYKQFQQVLADNPPYNFITYQQALYGVNKKVDGIKIKTLGHHGAGFLWNLEEWTIHD